MGIFEPKISKSLPPEYPPARKYNFSRLSKFHQWHLTSFFVAVFDVAPNAFLKTCQKSYISQDRKNV